MEIYQLRTFVTVAREGSITRASELLFTSQPAVSAHVKAIEEELGLQLFERTPKGMVLTTAGERLLERARQTLDAHRALLGEAVALRGQLSGKVTIGHLGNTSAGAVGRLLGALADVHPALEVNLRHGSSAGTLDGVRSGAIDAGFAVSAGLDDSSLSVLRIEPIDMYLALPPAWEALAAPGDWAALATLPWICPDPGSFCGRAAQALWAQHGIAPARTLRVDQDSVTRTLVAGGVGVGLVHGEAALRAKEEGAVVLWQGAPVATAHLVFAHAAQRAGDPLVRAVADVAQARLAGPPAPGDATSA